MLHAPTDQRQPIEADNPCPCDELEHLRVEVARLRSQNRHLRAALDAHIARAGSPSLYGPIELTAGTCVVPRRQTDGP